LEISPINKKKIGKEKGKERKGVIGQ